MGFENININQLGIDIITLFVKNWSNNISKYITVFLKKNFFSKEHPKFACKLNDNKLKNVNNSNPLFFSFYAHTLLCTKFMGKLGFKCGKIFLKS